MNAITQDKFGRPFEEKIFHPLPVPPDVQPSAYRIPGVNGKQDVYVQAAELPDPSVPPAGAVEWLICVNGDISSMFGEYAIPFENADLAPTANAHGW